MTKTRIIAALIMAPLAIAAVLLLSTDWLLLLAALAFLGALWEWLKLAGIEDTLARSILLACNLGLMVALVWATRSPIGGLPLLQLTIVLGVLWWLLALWWLRHYDFAANHAGNACIYKLGAGTLAVVPAWCAVAVIHANPEHGPGWLLLVLLLVWAADSGAYFSGRKFGGRWFGGRKLAPRISPNKTLEGLAGGVATAVLVCLIGAVVLGVPFPKLPAVALVAIIATLFSVAGDLFESLLKRHAGHKDSGNLIPGHGGLLDRLDSVLAALPVFYLGKALFGF